MATGALSSTRASQHDLRWKYVLLVLCALAFAEAFVCAADLFGLGERPWFGWVDAHTGMTGQPFLIIVQNPTPNGASAKAGLKDGDLLDLRELTREARIWMTFQPIATRPLEGTLRRKMTTVPFSLLPSTVWEGASRWKLADVIPGAIGQILLPICALLIALRCFRRRDGRRLALVLLFLALGSNGLLVLPNASLSLLFFLSANACSFAGLLLFINLSARFGVRNRWRGPLEWLAYATCSLSFLCVAAGVVGLLTLWFDPLPYFFGSSLNALNDVGYLAVSAVAVAAVVSAPLSERSRAAWLLLPIVIAFDGSSLVNSLANSGADVFRDWYLFVGTLAIGNLLWMLGAVAVTYALLKRRVLDFEFVLGRAIVVAIVSLIVVVSFVLLESVLGSALVGMSHATSIVANIALALILGVSLNYIQKGVETLVDTVLFRKRRADERALRDFAREAAYVTQSSALLDQTIEKIKRHTDARSAALLLDAVGAFEAVRSFGEGTSLAIDENDGVILALKAWHKPIDPHRHSSTAQAALALPMLGRGRLLGVLLLGERVGGEAYAPDEVEALSELAHGVGSGLDALSSQSDPLNALHQSMAAIADVVAALGDKMDSLSQTIAETTRISPIG